MDVAAQNKFLTTKEVAALTRKSESTMRYLAQLNQGPKSFKLGRKRLYAVEDVEAWIESARAQSAGGAVV